MKAFTFQLLTALMLLGYNMLSAQDFLLRCCDNGCQDSIVAGQWMKKLNEQVPDLAYQGFTYIWLPSFKTEDKTTFSNLVKTLKKAGIQPIMDLNIANGKAMFQLKPLWEQLRNDFQIKSFRMVSPETPEPVIVANFLNEYHQENPNPGLVFADIPNLEKPEAFAQWIRQTIENLPEETRQNILPRVYDYPLREALHQACSDPDFDVRDIYTHSLRDATTLIGYNVIVGINQERFVALNQKSENQSILTQDPLLAYAYLLTNNQIGLPEIFYADYFGKASGNPHYADKQPLKKEIDQLLKAHRAYIFNSTEIEYLNRKDSDKPSVFLSAKEGADATRALLFQLDGRDTPAGQGGKKRRDVLVAINFAEVPLKVVQALNPSNLQPGDTFTDILERSDTKTLQVQTHPDLHIANSVYMEVPPRSYSIWVQGEAAPVKPGAVTLVAETFDDFVELTWEAPQEGNVQVYELEKSINGSPFRKIVTLKPLGELGAHYLHTDEERLPEDEVTYRVKTIGKTGTVTYSAVQQLKPRVKGVSFELLEHPQPGVKTIKIKSDQPSEGKFAVFNAEGKQVVGFSQPIKSGVSLAQIDLSTLPSGVYLLNVQAKEKVWTKKIVNR